MTSSVSSHRTRQPATEIAASTTPLPLVSHDLHLPFSNQAVFWKPRHLAASPMLGQIPFLFWLIGTVRPRTVVQIGVGDGVVYMALCQAIERLGDSAICWGIQAEEPLMPAGMRAMHDEQYSDFSELLQQGPESALRHFDGEVDLLILNQPLDNEALSHIHNEWLTRLSDRSVIIVCHPDTVFPDADARRDLFPHRERTITLGPVSTGGHALEVLLFGDNQAERLVSLAALYPGMPAYLACRQVFNRLGQGIEATHKAGELEKECRLLHDSLHSADIALSARDVEVKALGQAKIKLEAQLAETQSEHDDRIQDIAFLTEKYNIELQQYQNKNNNASGSDKIVSLEKAMGDLSAKLLQSKKENELIAVKYVGLQKRFAKIEASREKIRRSVSWRMTWPIRAVGRLFK